MIKCIIVDDEKPARDLIELHLSGLTGFTLLAAFDNAIDAFNFLQKNEVDLMFLDIQMPKMNGTELVRSLKHCPRVILTTAFREYAVEAFELDVLDYLVKPVTQERFIRAISKFTYYANTAAAEPRKPPAVDNAYIFLKVNREQAKIFLNDILFIEGFKDYIKVHLKDKRVLAYERLSYMEEKLPEHKFLRIHKSYIIALDKISQYTAGQVTIAGTVLPVGRIFKNSFLKKMQG